MRMAQNKRLNMKFDRRLFSRVSGLAAFALAVGIAGQASAAPVDFTTDSAHSRIQFMAYTKLFDTLGVFKKYKVDAKIDPDDLSTMKLKISVDTKSVDTDNSSRDDHLRKEDFFHSSKFPKATFELKKVEVKGEESIVVTGPLTIRGVTQEVTVPVDVVRFEKEGRKVIRLKGKFTVDRNKFGVSYKPGILMPSIKDNVDIMIDINLLGPKP